MGVLWLRKSVEQLSYEYNISIKEINRLKSVYQQCYEVEKQSKSKVLGQIAHTFWQALRIY